MPRASKAPNARDDAVHLIDRWLESCLGRTSDDRENVIEARRKIHTRSGTLSPDEIDAVIACVMDELDIESDRAEAIIDLVQSMSSSE